MSVRSNSPYFIQYNSADALGVFYEREQYVDIVTRNLLVILMFKRKV